MGFLIKPIEINSITTIMRDASTLLKLSVAREKSSVKIGDAAHRLYVARLLSKY